jgi:putative hemolysin
MEAVLLKVGLALVGLLGSAYFSAVEISLISASRLRLRQLSKQGQHEAALALDLLRDQELVLATTLIGLNLCNLATAAFATSILEGWLGLGWTLTLTSTLGVTLVILVFGELVPKVYGKQRADSFLVANARPVLATEQLLLPVTALIRVYLKLLLRILRRAPRRPFVTREDLKVLVHDVKGMTGPGRKERKMLRSILDFSETTVREVMVPMTEVASIERESSTDLLRALAKRHGFTRIPVYTRRIDRVIGLVNVYDVLFDPEHRDQIAPYIRDAILVPETKRIDRLMVDLQRGHQTMAIVVSEFGSCVGIVTMEDIVEEIVGEMAEEDEVGVRKIRQIAPRTYIADGLTDIDDVNDELALELPKGRYDTLGGLILKHYGRIPREGESFERDGLRVEVVDVHRFGVRSVKLVLPEEAAGERDL